MGKASSAKKVARAARAGGKRRTGQRRQLGFPVALALIVILGLVTVFVAKTSNDASADEKNPPRVGDHWHAAYGTYICDHFVTNLGDEGTDALGVHTHEDGLIHIHPFQAAAAGKQANLGKFFDQTGLNVTGSEIKLPAAKPFGGRVYKAGETTCDGKPASVRVAHWKNALEAAKGKPATRTFTSDISGIRLSEDLGAYTFAFVAKGAKVPAPPGAADILQNAQNDQAPAAGGGVPPGGNVPPGSATP